jgi:hypothetical protein
MIESRLNATTVMIGGGPQRFLRVASGDIIGQPAANWFVPQNDHGQNHG